MRMRSRAMRRCARRPDSCRSWSRRCLQDGTHTLEESRKATGRVLQAVYTELHDQRLDYRGTLLSRTWCSRGTTRRTGRGAGSCGGDAGVLLQARAGGGARDRLSFRAASPTRTRLRT
jgi:hypothetical protein